MTEPGGGFSIRAFIHRTSRTGRTRAPWLVLLAASGCLAGACAEHMERAALLERIQNGTAPLIVDVRSRGEFEESHVPGAVHVPFYSILSGARELPRTREAGEPIVLYCEHGPRAGIARAQLWFVEYRPVRFLEGHMTAWKADGLPVEPGVQGVDEGGP